MKISIHKEINMLQGVPIFAGLTNEELRIIALMTENYIYEAGDLIIKEGEEGHEAFIIYSGKTEVSRNTAEGKDTVLNVLGPGEMFGELALFGDGVRTATVKAVEETYVAVISKEKIFQIIREFPDIAIEMLKVQTKRFTRAENRLMGFLQSGPVM